MCDGCLFGAKAFASKKGSELDIDFQGKFSDRERNQVVQDLANMRRLPSDLSVTGDVIQAQQQSRQTKKKMPRQSNNEGTERVFPSGLIRGGMGDVDPGSVVPALRNQMPVVMSSIVPASQVSSACKCSKDFMWEDNRGSHCEARGMPCNMPNQIGMLLL